MKLTVGLGIIILLLGGAIFLVSQNDSTSNPVTLPAVELQNTDGSPAFVHDYLDGEKILVVNSWATWCPFCVNELPDLVALQEEFSDEVVVVAVNRRESISESTAYLENLGVGKGLVYLYDPSDAWYRELGGFTMPETTFINARGEIIVHKRGFMALPEMREHVETTLMSN